LTAQCLKRPARKLPRTWCPPATSKGIFTSDANSAEFFGFFAVSGKFASVFGPLIYGILFAITGNVQSGILSVHIFFTAGMVILWTFDKKKGSRKNKNPSFREMLNEEPF
jgi:UMF1 family MFS transporter